MAVWEWIIAYVVGFTLLQVLVYRYLRGSGRGAVGRLSPGEPDPDGAAPPAIERVRGNAPEVGGTTRPCPHCGTPNEGDQTFDYCRNCVHPLSG